MCVCVFCERHNKKSLSSKCLLSHHYYLQSFLLVTREFHHSAYPIDANHAHIHQPNQLTFEPMCSALERFAR